MPALPPQDFLKPITKPKRRIKAKSFSDYDSKNPISKYVINNSRGFNLLSSRGDQYKNSFFVRTVVDWNHLKEDVVNCKTVKSFQSALGLHRPN